MHSWAEGPRGDITLAALDASIAISSHAYFRGNDGSPSGQQDSFPGRF